MFDRSTLISLCVCLCVFCALEGRDEFGVLQIHFFLKYKILGPQHTQQCENSSFSFFNEELSEKTAAVAC